MDDVRAYVKGDGRVARGEGGGGQVLEGTGVEGRRCFIPMCLVPSFPCQNTLLFPTKD